MANTLVAQAVEVTEQEHSLGELSRANLQTAKSLFESNGIVVWRCLWGNRDLDHETLNLLGSLPTEKNFIYVNARSLLPREIVNNKFMTAFLASQFPTARLLQIYARHATTTGTISLRSSDAVAPLLVQVIIAHDEHPLSVKIDCGGSCIHLKGNGLAVVRYSARDITIHIESRNYTVVTLDYALSGET